MIPEALEHERRCDALDRLGLEPSAGGVLDDSDAVGESAEALEDGVDVALCLELIESSDGGDDALSDGSVFPAVFDDLEVTSCAGLLCAYEHG